MASVRAKTANKPLIRNSAFIAKTSLAQLCGETAIERQPEVLKRRRQHSGVDKLGDALDVNLLLALTGLSDAVRRRRFLSCIDRREPREIIGLT